MLVKGQSPDKNSNMEKHGLGALDNVIKELFVHTIQNVNISQTTGGYKGISPCQQIFCTVTLQAKLLEPVQQ
jgi:hypothetical protein